MDTFKASEKLVVFLGRGSLNQHRCWFGKNLPIRLCAPFALLITGRYMLEKDARFVPI